MGRRVRVLTRDPAWVGDRVCSRDVEAELVRVAGVGVLSDLGERVHGPVVVGEVRVVIPEVGFVFTLAVPPVAGVDFH